MKVVDTENWKRKDHYNYFKSLDYPQFNVCANLEITKLYKYIKENGLPFFITVLYISVKAANEIKEFRYRIREEKVVEHDTVSPSFTVLTEGNVFSFCGAGFSDDYGTFKADAGIAIEKVRNNISIEDEPGRDDLLYVTSLPWVSFTSITHPVHMNPVDSIPRISWGKFFEENGKIKLPFSVQVHHALVDGFHVGQYYNRLQELSDNPQNYL